MPITESVIREIKSQVDIASVVGEYVHSLKKSGKNWIGLCPFHNDNHPSFTVSSEHGSYKCWSCGEWGDVIKFVEKIENLTFSEAVKMLAARIGINVDTEAGDTRYKEKDQVLSFNERVVKLFQHFLKERSEGAMARQYLQNRSLDLETIDKFRLGYAPRGYGRLEKFFINKGFSPDFLMSTGLFAQGDRGLKTLFFDRVIFPIINYKNEVVGFGGRTLDPNGKPKYINTPETLVYKKRDNLYGLNVAKDEIQKQKMAFLVEGYMDVITCYRSGLKNVVAPCGTAITAGQIRLLSRYAQEIVFLLDGDEAGIKGAARGLFETANIETSKFSVLVLPNGMDPDDYFKQNNLSVFKDFFSQRVEPIDFLVFYSTKNVNLKDYTELVKCLEYLFSYVKLWQNKIIQNALIDRIAQSLGLDTAMITNAFVEYEQKNSKKVFAKNAEPDIQPNQSQHLPKEQHNALTERDKYEIDFIIYAIHCSQYEEIARRCGFDEKFLDTNIGRRLYAWMKQNTNEVSRKTITDAADSDCVKEYINEVLFNLDKLIITEEKDDKDKADDNYSAGIDSKLIADNIYDRIYEIKKHYYINQSRMLTEKIKYGELYKDEMLVKELQEDKIVLQREMNKLARIKKLKNTNGAENNE